MTSSRYLRLLAALLGAPEAESLAVLRDIGARFPWLHEAVAELERWPLEQWQAEHTRLFVNGYPTTPCLPFASHWRHGCMHGPVAGELQAFLARAGFAGGAMPPDYLGLLLECGAHLGEQATEAHHALRRELWQEHLKPWLPQFAAALREHSGLGLYRLVGTRLQELCGEQC